ncbi:hypothetical protein [Qipengyuania nanhaisediminis]|uniref:hypothetical protein n=1 Tax=Qipengyuania nanhaisediminis TaxID=604088 RepID=UPI0038B2B10A
MALLQDNLKSARLRLPLLGACAAMMLALPSAGLALVTIGADGIAKVPAFDLFTPASVDPELAARVERKARERGIRFTPTGTSGALSDRTVTVAVRVDGQSAQAIQIRSAAEGAPGPANNVRGLQASRFNLGTARGYQSFARPQAATRSTPVSGSIRLPDNVRNLAMPDLAEFEPARPSRRDAPSRLQPRIELEDNAVPGRSLNTLDANEDSVDVGGSFSLSPNFDVTAGVRYSRERDRLDPLTSTVQDSQAVYVGTQVRF